jgi:plasmid stabilization system protein ParE
MNIQAEKIELVKMLLDTENPRIIESIKKNLKRAKTTDFWDDLSIEQRKEIEKASLEIENGEVTDYDSFMQNTDELSRKVVISKTAERKLDKLFEYLTTEWSIKVKTDFVKKLDSSIEIIRNQPEIFPESRKGKSLRKCVITKQTTLFYRYNSKRINIVTIFDTRQNLNKLDKEI